MKENHRQQLARRIISLYGFSSVDIYPEQTGYRNRSYRFTTEKSENLNLIIYKDEPDILDRINKADKISECAHLAGLPTRFRRSSKTVQIKSKNNSTIARLYNYLPGKTIPWEQYTKKHIKLLGWSLSDLHAELKNQDSAPNLESINDRMLSLVDEMNGYLSSAGVASAIRKKLKVDINLKKLHFFSDFLKKYKKQSSQPLHMDFVRGNILFTKNKKNKTFWQIGAEKLVGIIDFEKVASGSVLFDVARTYAFLLVDCSKKTPEKIFKYFVLSGYNKRGKNTIELSDKNMKSLSVLTDLFLLYDFYKFLLHNPYESLKENHHFVVTKDILLKRKMLKSI